jgi:hypothetical protein
MPFGLFDKHALCIHVDMCAMVAKPVIFSVFHNRSLVGSHFTPAGCGFADMLGFRMPTTLAEVFEP